ncbi:MAG: M20/M25/M40 family metallo-hydrolase [Chloroflexi bacterium]|jgi:acetylornithine deacetylase/succinyl-diaminopimelate desuccinylase-like protein|nr:M20/M25/M40 family metallo-hydrolase [Chloroflexota bacterium]
MNDLLPALIDLARQIQQIPAPPFGEQDRARFVLERMLQENLDECFMDELPNVYGCLRSVAASRPPLIVTAHLDTVFPPETDLRCRTAADRLEGPGIGDNSLGVAALFGLLWMLRQHAVRLPFDLWLIANSGEEGLGNLRGMKAVVDRFGGEVSAYVVLEGMALGYVYHRGTGVQRYHVGVHTPGGHPWGDPDVPSAIHILGNLIASLTALPLSAPPRTTLNIGRMGGGSGINVIASEAWMELDLRSESEDALRRLREQVLATIKKFQQPSVTIELRSLGERPAGELPATHPLVRLAKACLQHQGIAPILTSGSTDANLPLSRGYPAITLGITRGGAAHTLQEFIEIPPIRQGMAQLFELITRAGSL